MSPRDGRASPEGPPAGATPALIRWGAVIGGGVIGLSLLVLLAALWLALGFGTGIEAIQTNIDWFLAISSVVALFVGGLLAGWLAGVPGFAPGLFNGLTVWGLVLTVSLLIGTPGVLQMTGVPADVNMTGVPTQALWASFAAMLIGAIAAAIGGGVGGMISRPAFVYAQPAHEEPRDEARRDERPADERRAEERPARGRRAAREPEEAPTNGGTVRR